MATETVSMAVYAQQQQGIDPKNLNLEEFVRNATWKDLLSELVQSNRLDPWNIDLGSVVEGYVGAVKRMKVLDLHIPANIIFAAALLLRMKSDSLVIIEPEELPVQEDPTGGIRVRPEVPALIQKIRIQPGKRITLIELMNALEDAIKIKEERELLAQSAPPPRFLALQKEDIEEKIAKVYETVKGHADKEGMITFGELVSGMTDAHTKLTEVFVPLLFLTHSRKVVMMQEKFFEEIFVKLSEEVENDAGGAA